MGILILQPFAAVTNTFSNPMPKYKLRKKYFIYMLLQLIYSCTFLRITTIALKNGSHLYKM